MLQQEEDEIQKEKKELGLNCIHIKCDLLNEEGLEILREERGFTEDEIEEVRKQWKSKTEGREWYQKEEDWYKLEDRRLQE